MLLKLQKIFFVCFNIIFCITLILFTIFYTLGRDLPNETILLNYSPYITSKIKSRNCELMEEYSIEHRTTIPFNKISKNIIQAFLIAEDKNFYEHSGIKITSLLRAILGNIYQQSWKKQSAGGSTITQQLAKNIFVGNKRNINRKIREAIMAFRIERTIPKNKILEIYLNHIYLGKGCYGIAEAANYYFGKNIFNLTSAESTFLAAIPSAPSIYLISDNIEKLLTPKRNAILYQMYQNKIISQKEFQIAIHQNIIINNNKLKLFAPYFSDEIFKILTKYTSTEEFFKSGYEIITTMDKNIQKYATQSLENGLIKYTKKQKWVGTICNIKLPCTNLEKILNNINQALPTTYNKIIACVIIQINLPKKILTCQINNFKQINVKICYKYQPKIGDVFLCRFNEDTKEFETYQTPKITGGIVVMNPENGDILAMSGGYSFDISSFNCITQAKRQPGSTIKPFIYAAALEQGFSEYKNINDTPVSIILSDNQIYHPKNNDRKSLGKILLRNGLIYSRNQATINLASSVGAYNIKTLLSKMHLVPKTHSESKFFPISAVLGSIETTPIDLVSAFSAFFNQGKMVYPRFFLSIKNRKNEEILQSLSAKKIKNVLSVKTAETIKKILHDIARYGTAKALYPLEKKLKAEIGGKTGTTNECKDAWFVGYIIKNHKTYLIGVFVGYEQPKSLGKKGYGSIIALPIFADFISKLAKNYHF